MEKTDDLFSDILRCGPSQETILLVLERMKEEGRTDAVIRECKKALDIYPDDIRLRVLLAESYQEAGFFDEAGSEIKRITSMINELSLIYKSQAEILARQHMDKQASEMLQRYLAHHPEDQGAVDLLNKVEADKEDVEADTASPIEYASSENSQVMFAELATPTLAELYYDQGKIEEAVHTYERVMLENPEDSASRRRLDELRTLMSQEKEKETGGEGKLMAKRKKAETVAILEGWLARLQELRHA
jgi:tetratricopeptide (TPR) repeat protein